MTEDEERRAAELVDDDDDAVDPQLRAALDHARAGRSLARSLPRRPAPADLLVKSRRRLRLRRGRKIDLVGGFRVRVEVFAVVVLALMMMVYFLTTLL
ncbi:MAG: hypothetical protein EXR76_01480 [Myxococcales bacterium]|nr:hypothetical protein [Myxococcales bacterium]